MIIYINWKDQDVVTEMQMETVVEEEIEKAESNKDDFAVWLNNHYSAYDIWNMNDSNLLDKILNDWHKWCVDGVERFFYDDWDEYDLPNA